MRGTVPRQTSVQEGTMKLLFFDDFKLGLLKGDAVIDVSETVRNIPHTGPHDLISGLIARFTTTRSACRRRSTGDGECRSARPGSGRPCRSPPTSWRWR